MDGLALNIFVPVERKSKFAKKKAQPVVKSSKLGKNSRKSLEIKAKNAVSSSLNGADKPLSTLSPGKPKTGKQSAGKPFLVSRSFNKSPNVKDLSNDDAPEVFTASFVKPKLFQRKRISNKPETKALKETVVSNIDKSESVDVNEEQGTSSKIGHDKNEVPASAHTDGLSVPQRTVEFSGRTKPPWGKHRDRQKPDNADVFVAQTFSKWSLPAGTNDKVRVDFPSVGSSGSKSTVPSKRKFPDSSTVGSKRRKNDLNEGIDVEKYDGSKKGGRNGRTNLEWQQRSEVNSGPTSSLYSAVDVEKLDNLDVEPVEERLFSSKQFSDVGVHPHLIGNLEQLFGITKMTVVQKKTIPVLLSGKDGLVRSQTGSGKTLAYAIPIMHRLAEMKPQLTRKDGVKALVVLPTRELALQTYECFAKLMRAFTWIVPGIVVGGEKRKSEKTRLRKGITVLIGTLGRLLDHAEHTENLSLHGIDWLIIDEADKLLEMGYEKDITSLMSIIDGQREKSESVGRKQTVLLSATLTSGVERLANLALKDPVRIDACGNTVLEDVLVIPTTLQQEYVVVPAKMRLVALASFLIDVAELKKSNKILVFMATQDMVDFYLELLQGVLSSTVKFYKLHGNMSQTDRTEVFNRFRSSDKGVLLSTDVAARGLDLPKVDWIVQYTAPTTPSEYVHRVGRTARVGTTGSALLFLLPSELHFVSMLNSSRIKLGEASIDQYLKSLMKIHLESKDGQRWGGGVEGAATVLQHNFEHSILEDPALHDIAAKAYKSWVRFYATYPKDLRVVFDFKSLHLGHNAKSFALRDPPKAIGGIGKPVKGDKRLRNGGNARRGDKRKRKSEGLGHVTSGSRTKKLILSEFDSGLKPTKRS